MLCLSDIHIDFYIHFEQENVDTKFVSFSYIWFSVLNFLIQDKKNSCILKLGNYVVLCLKIFISYYMNIVSF
jgi:hypothetical protein